MSQTTRSICMIRRAFRELNLRYQSLIPIPSSISVVRTEKLLSAITNPVSTAVGYLIACESMNKGTQRICALVASNPARGNQMAHCLSRLKNPRFWSVTPIGRNWNACVRHHSPKRSKIGGSLFKSRSQIIAEVDKRAILYQGDSHCHHRIWTCQFDIGATD